MATQPYPITDYFVDTIDVDGIEYRARFAIWGERDLSDATAVSADILYGKTAYTGAGKIVGSYVPIETLYWETFD